MDVYKRLKEMNITLPLAPGLGGEYNQVVHFGNNDSLAYVSGTGPCVEEGIQFAGKLGIHYNLEEGREAARCAVLNMLAVIEKNIGDLNRIKRFVKLLCFVASDNEFYQQPKVADGASTLLIEIFGEDIGRAARSAIGVNVLPHNIPFEIEAVIELTD